MTRHRRPDLEQSHGIFSLALVLLALVVGPVLWLTETLAPPARVWVTLAAFVLGVTVASTNWRPPSLRAVALVALATLALMLVGVGREVHATAPVDDAAAQVAALGKTHGALVTALTDVKEQRSAALAKAVTTLTDAVDQARDSTVGSTALVSHAQAALAAISAKDSPGLAQASAAFSGDFPAAPAPVLVELQAALGSAVTAYERVASPPDVEPARRAIAEACAAVNAADPGPTEPCDTDADGVAADGVAADGVAKESVPVAVAIARLRIAELRAALFARPEDTTAVTEAKAAATTARAATTEWEARKLSFGAALSTGASTVLVGRPPVGSGDVALVPELVVWILVALVALTFWRWVERRSARQLPGPVRPTLTPYAPKDNDTSAEQKALFRAALLRNVSEPAAVPGSTTMQSLTDLVELAPAGAATWLTPVVKAISSVLKAPVGYDVDAEVSPSLDAGSGSRCTVLVRISDRSTGGTVVMNAVRGKTPSEACRTAGHWAAAAVLERSTRIPRWARWTPDSSEALAAYDDASDVDDVEPSSSELARAVAAAPNSGVLMHRWADQHDLNKEYLGALGLYARAVAAHPRFPAGKYRLAVSLAMLGRASVGNEPGGWSEATATEQARIAAQVTRACSGLGLDEAVIGRIGTLRGAEPVDASNVLLDTSTAVFTKLGEQARWRSIVAASIRRSERDVFWPPGWSKIMPGGEWSRVKWLAKSAMHALPGAELDELRTSVERQAERPDSFWQLCYNVACSYATRVVDPPADDAHTSVALEWLEKALERPGSGQMGGGWLQTDPDLTSLHGSPRFAWVASQVDDNRKVAETGA